MEPQKLPMNKLVEQLDFYFEPINIDTDRYLRLCVQATPNGFVEISTIHTFNLIRENSREEIVEAVKASDKLELSPNATELRSIIPYQRNENLKDHMVYLFNPAQDSNHTSIKASVLEKGGPVPIKVGCKRDNETGNCYGAKQYFRTPRDTEEFIDKFMRDEKGLVKDISVEKDKEGGLAKYDDYTRMMKDLSESKKDCLMMLNGLKGYDLKNQKNVIKTMIKRELNEQGVGARNIMITEKECTKCLVIFESKEKVEETTTKDLSALKIDNCPVELKQLTAVEVDDILREIGEKRQEARDRGVRRPFQRSRRGGGRRMGRGRGDRGGRGRGGMGRGGMGRGGPRGYAPRGGRDNRGGYAPRGGQRGDDRGGYGGQRGGFGGDRGGYGGQRGGYGGDRGGDRGGYGGDRGGYGGDRGGYGGQRGGYAPQGNKRANVRGGPRDNRGGYGGGRY